MANARPFRVRYNGTWAFLDDTQANRIQSFGSTGRLQSSDVFELGTLGIAEVIDDIPQVDVSIDQNEIGNNEMVGLFANKSYGLNVMAAPSGTAIGTMAVQVFPGSYYANGERVYFAGNQNLTVSGTGNYVVSVTNDNTATVTVNASGSVPAGNIQLASISLASGSTMVSQANITDKRSWATVAAQDFELAKCDIYVPIKAAGATTISRTMYMKNVFANSIDLSYSTSGLATASYRAETDNKTWYLNNSQDIVYQTYKVTATGTATISLDQTPQQLANGNYMLKVTKSGQELTEGTDFTVNAGTPNLVINSSAFPCAVGDIVSIRYTANAGGTNFVSQTTGGIVSLPWIPAGLREGQIEIYLSDDLNNRMTRVQSARMTATLRRDALGELGSLYPYNRPLELPIDVTATLDFRDSDLQVAARLAGFNPATVQSIDLTDFLKNYSLVIKMYRENDVLRAKLPAGHPNLLPMKTVTVPNLIPTNEAWQVQTNNDATQSFEFRAHDIQFNC